MPKSINRTKSENIKCSNCKYAEQKQLGVIEVLVCKINNVPVDYWDKCKDFEWSEDKQYSDSTQVNVSR